MSKAASKNTPKNKPKGKPGGIPTGKVAPRPARQSKPTLPQHELPAPYDRLLTLGSTNYDTWDAEHAKIATILTETNAQEAVARLTGVALDTSYAEYADLDHPSREDARVYARLHAVGVLSLMGEAAQAAIDPLLPLLDEEDDDLREEIPLFYASIGQAAVEPLRRVLQNPDADTYMRTGAGDSLEQIGETHAHLRPTIVPLLEQSLLNAGDDDVMASFLVCNLLDLDAKESLPLIQQAYAENRVDTSVVSINDVEEHFGLPLSNSSDKMEDDMLDPADRETVNAMTGSQVDGFVLPTPFVKPVKLGRNDPCWCNSGKKYKQCHGG